MLLQIYADFELNGSSGQCKFLTWKALRCLTDRVHEEKEKWNYEGSCCGGLTSLCCFNSSR